jgi:hypothetical protein
MSLHIEDLQASIELFNDTAEDELDERYIQRAKLMDAAKTQQEYDFAYNLDGQTLYDFIFCVQDGDPRTGALEANLSVGLAEFVQDDINETRSYSTWLVFSLNDELFRVEGTLKSLPDGLNKLEIVWDYASLRKVQKRVKFVEVNEYV